ncbi:MAG: histidinol-phosphate transaminase [Dissulfurispiraceae bacterium]|jgi:histidinol-phosphate aminotransferase|nr:histidinol-phosphate transaminase [Dissulfurispiraceae bacterium]
MNEKLLLTLPKKNIRALDPYSAKEIKCRIKLDGNESPYAISGLNLKKCLSLPLNRYPDPEAKALRKVLAKDAKISPEMIVCGNGSDELINCLITVYGGPVLCPVPTFAMYSIISKSLGVEFRGIPLNKNFDLDEDRMLNAVKQHKPKLIFMSSPNNPTGNCFSSATILKLINASKGIVVVDEAYQPFASERGFMPMLEDFPNLVILRTLSKIGLAGLRTGFAAANPLIINEINKVRLPYNINSLSQSAAVEGLKNKKIIRTNIKKIVDERLRVYDGLNSLNGITAFPSEANFILFKTESTDNVYNELLKKGILVKNLSSSIKGCLRVTVGSEKENAAFLKALGSIIKNQLYKK